MNAGIKVEGVKVDMHISGKLKGNILCACMTSTNLYGLKTTAMTQTASKMSDSVHIFLHTLSVAEDAINI